jgi:hypothetical protein
MCKNPHFQNTPKKMKARPGTDTLEMNRQKEQPEPNTAYKLEVLLHVFGLKKLNQRFADLEMFEKDGWIFLFKKIGGDLYKLHLSHPI